MPSANRMTTPVAVDEAQIVMTSTTMGRQGRPDTSAAVAGLIRFLETGSAPGGLFAPDAFADLSLPRWRPPVADDVFRGPRRVHLHPAPGGLWLVGPEEAAVPLRALRGFGYEPDARDNLDWIL